MNRQQVAFVLLSYSLLLFCGQAIATDLQRPSPDGRDRGQARGISNCAGAGMYSSIWDKTGEGSLCAIVPEAPPRICSGAPVNAPQVLDDIWLQLTALKTN